MAERRIGGFESLPQALEYAAAFTQTGMTWFDAEGQIETRLSYAQIHARAHAMARWLQQHQGGVPHGARIGILGQTGPHFLPAFCACHLLGWIPCPLPMPSPLQEFDHYACTLEHMRQAAGMSLLLGPAQVLDMLRGHAQAHAGHIATVPFEVLAAAPGVSTLMPLPDVQPHDIAYVQFSSGSTAQPKGIAISHGGLMYNVNDIHWHGMRLTEEDHAFSWLPYYHDMGLVGFALTSICAQISVDYISPALFSRKPGLWMRLVGQRRCTISYAPGFAWQLAAMHEAELPPDIRLDALRIAGLGGDRVLMPQMQAFAEKFAKRGFNPDAFKPSYGLAEATLAVSMSVKPFAQIQQYWRLDEGGRAEAADATDSNAWPLIECGEPLPGWKMTVRPEQGQELAPGNVGTVFIQGPAQATGVFVAGQYRPDPPGQAINTGDTGFMDAHGVLFITGRQKDMMIVNGRNLWPQDVEHAVSERTALDEQHLLVFQGSQTNQQGRLVLLVHEQALRPRTESVAGTLRRAAAVATSMAGEQVHAYLVPDNAIARTPSGKKARAAVRARFESGLIRPIDVSPVLQQEQIA